MTAAVNVTVAVTGDVYVAPTGTALPVTTAAVPNVAFQAVGYLTEDGITESQGDTTTEIKAWQNADVVRRIQTDHSAQFKMTFLEVNSVSLREYYGGNYAAGIVQIKAGVTPRKSWIIDTFDGSYKIRIVIPDGQIVERGDVTYKNGDAISFPITIECYPDSTGVKAYVYHATASVSL